MLSVKWKQIKMPVFILVFGATLFAERPYHYTNVAGGLSLALGPGMNPGAHFLVEPVAVFHPYFGAGLHADYTWMTAQTGRDDIRSGVHLIGAAGALKGYIGNNDELFGLLEFNPGIVLAVGYIDYGDKKDTYMNPRFCLTYGAGLCVRKFLVGINFKSVFVNALDRGSTAHWMNFYVGFAGS